MKKRLEEERKQLIKLLNDPTFDNKRNELNADLFVNNLKNTLKAFGFNPKIKYNVYRHITIYNVSWLDDKTYSEFKENEAEIALSLGIPKEELAMKKIGNNEVEIKVPNMKMDTLCLKELLCDFKSESDTEIPLGLDDEDHIVPFDYDKDGSLLVTGVTGIGKTNLFNSIILSTLINYKDVKIIILDSQKINYNDYKNICEVITDEDLIINKIKEIRKEFEKRIKNNELNKEKLIIFIDEMYKILGKSNSVDEDINYLVQEGDKANINFVVCTDSILIDDIKRIFTNKEVTKLSFYLTTKDEYKLFLNKKVNSSLERDGVYLETQDELNRITIPLIKDDEIIHVVDKVVENEKDKE